MKPNWNKVYLLSIILLLLTGALGYGFCIAFNAHSTTALITGVGTLLVYAPIVLKLSNAIEREFEGE